MWSQLVGLAARFGGGRGRANGGGVRRDAGTEHRGLHHPITAQGTNASNAFSYVGPRSARPAAERGGGRRATGAPTRGGGASAAFAF